VTDTVYTRIGRDLEDQQTREAFAEAEGIQVSERFRQFARMVLEGKLPDIGEVPELDPQIQALTAELQTVHLPEWRNPAGRKLADPATVQVPLAPRVAQYLFERGWRHHPELETIRWHPTPGGGPQAHDDGLHVHPDENGQWPDPDPELFYDFDDIKVRQHEDGQWGAWHPRGTSFTAATKSEAYAGLVDRLRRKIEEARNA